MKGMPTLALPYLVSLSLLFGVQSVLAEVPSRTVDTFESGEVITETHQVFLPLAQTGDPTLPWQPNDPYYSSQWAIEKTGALAAWKTSRGEGMLLAVLDSGVDFCHVDLMGKVRDDIDWDFVNDDDDAQDDYGHGTHVSGIAAATPDNGEGVAGVGWDIEILPLKVLNGEGQGAISDVIAAIYYAVDAGADVINMSFSTSASSPIQCEKMPALVAALEYAYQHDVLVVVAAGNDGVDAAQIAPANCPYVLTVAATTSSDGIASFSNYGSVVDVAGPGASIYSTFLGNTYRGKNGTSMAAPFVAAVATLVWSRNPNYTPEEVAAAILDTALDLGESGWDPAFGCGRVQAASAVMAGTQTTARCREQALLSLPASSTSTGPTSDFDLQSALAVSGATGGLIVRFRDVDTVTSGALAATSVQVLHEGWVVIAAPSADAQSLVRQWLSTGAIESVQPDFAISVD
ncbi:MAG: S8 family serine peptidase [Anaerolineae bacterium]|nr:S8 family serine peptidase [Anaerolineae bacterium]